jgi:hypothetical protein
MRFGAVTDKVLIVDAPLKVMFPAIELRAAMLIGGNVRPAPIVTVLTPVPVGTTIVEVSLFSVRPVLVAVSQRDVPPAPERVQVPEPMLTTRVFALLLEKLETVTFWLLALNVPLVKVRALLVANVTDTAS